MFQLSNNLSFCYDCISSAKNNENKLEEYVPAPKPNGDELKVKNIDPCLYLNGTEHHTTKYELMKRKSNPHLVVRRGQSFKLHITLSRHFDQENDKIAFVFSTEDKKIPSFGRGTLISMSLVNESDTVRSWNAVLEENREDIITVRITPASDCIIGKWNMLITTKTTSMQKFEWNTNVYILFNPWCIEDNVYMESDDWRQELILNNDGMIWVGSATNFSPIVWKYSQFERDVLDCALYLINEVGKISGNRRADPVQVSRALSAAVNIQDDNGVVAGRWGDTFPGGTPPTQWTGSVDILQKYYSKKKPVKYGQCWVFAGVLTSVCRALGMPSRVVTNFSSAHDSDGSITLDHFVDKDGKLMDKVDSMWNFHVWTEAWMSRPDLGEAYSGWQAIDATPQERSNGMYRCGPASVVACKEGDVKKPYDTAFVYSEVNADMLYWYHNSDDNSLTLWSNQTKTVGQFISTKAPGKFERLDLTDSYKHKEGTADERAINIKAMNQVEHSFAKLYLNETFKDIQFRLGALDSVLIGRPFDIILTMTNKNDTINHNIEATIRIDISTYTGKLISKVKSETRNVNVKSKTTNQIKLSVSFEDYFKLLRDKCVFKISCIAHVQDTSYRYYERDDFQITMPNIEIKLDGSLNERKEITALMAFTNPLPIPIKNAYFLVDAPGLSKKLKLKVKDKIAPQQEIVQSVKFTPTDTGRQTIVAKFISKELTDVNGFHSFVVEGNVMM